MNRGITPPPAPKGKPGLGDWVERLVKPAAVALQSAGMVKCLDENKKLRPGSPCAKRRERLNALGRKLGI